MFLTISDPSQRGELGRDADAVQYTVILIYVLIFLTSPVKEDEDLMTCLLFYHKNFPK